MLLPSRTCRQIIPLLLFSGLTLLAQRPTERHQGHEVAANEILVKFTGTDASTIAQARAAADADEADPVGKTPGLYRLHSRNKNVATLLNEFSRRPDVVYVEPNYMLHVVTVPNDASFSALWGMQNIGATSAWEISTGSAANVVGVVDTGIDYNHPDLGLNVWSAPAAFTVTIGANTITCAAGTHGYNAITKTCDPMDNNNHGTHVSGTIGAVGNNGLGVAGVNWTTRIMGLKFLDATGNGTTANAINAIEFAIQAKAAFAGTGTPVNIRVLSNSWGGSAGSNALRDEINKANTNEMLFVAAAGNSAADNDVTPAFPSNFNTPNMVAVAANDNPDALAYFSNYGATTVHLSAPGVDVLSTIRGATYEYESGTSMATPHVSGAAMLLLSRCSLDTAALKTLLLKTVDPIPAQEGWTITGGRLNVDKALRSCTGSPSAYTLTAAPATTGPGSAVTVNWTTTTGRPTTDWIALYATGAPSSAYQWWQYTNGAASGSFTVPVPSTAGTYEFRYLAQNGHGEQARSNTVTVSSSVIVPTISAVQATNITFSSATISWTTATPADTQVEYGPTTAYGSTSTLDANKVTSHAVNLTGLTQSTAYHYRVRSKDAAGIMVISGDFTFTTPISPAGFSLTATPASIDLAGSFTLNWTAPSGRPTNDWIALYPMGAANNAQVWWQYTNGTTTGSVRVSAPALPGTYEFRYLLQNGYSDIVRSSILTVTASGITLTATPASVNPGNTVTVNWTAPAGRPANDWIGMFQVGAPNTPSIWWQYTSGATTGSATPPAPTALGQYEFRYLLAGGYSDVVHSNSFSVTAVVGPVISSVQATGITSSSANISWATSIAADSQVEYGTTTTYGSSTTLNTTKVTSHTVALAGLTASTLYHYRVKSTDAAGNTTVSGDFTFTTLAVAVYTLTATPATVSLGASVTASWTAPAGSPATDWVGFFAVGAPNSPAIAWQYTGGAATGSFTTTPASPGTFEFRYLLNGGYTDVTRSNTVTVSSGGFSLTATPASVNSGGSVTVNWTAPSGRPANDWFGLYQVGAPSSPSLWFQYTNGATTGSATVTVPTTLGTYEFRYFLAGGYTDVVHSNSFAVVAPVGPVISSVQATGITSSSANIGWTTSIAADSQVEYGTTTAYGLSTALNTTRVTSHTVAVIGLTAGTTYHYRVKSTDSVGNLAVSGDFTFTTASATVYTLTAAPATINLGASVTLNWIAPAGSSTTDWVGFFAVGAPNSPAIAWQYTGGATNGSFTTTPASPGTYEFRYLLNNSYTDVARSNTITVNAVGFSLTATPATVSAGGTVTVNWIAPSGRPTTDWVGLFRVGAPNSPAIAWQYTNGTANGSFSVTAPAQSGSYEFRYLLNGGYTDVARSNTVTVP